MNDTISGDYIQVFIMFITKFFCQLVTMQNFIFYQYFSYQI